MLFTPLLQTLVLSPSPVCADPVTGATGAHEHRLPRLHRAPDAAQPGPVAALHESDVLVCPALRVVDVRVFVVPVSGASPLQLKE